MEDYAEAKIFSWLAAQDNLEEKKMLLLKKSCVFISLCIPQLENIIAIMCSMVACINWSTLQLDFV